MEELEMAWPGQGTQLYHLQLCDLGRLLVPLCVPASSSIKWAWLPQHLESR